MSADDKSNNQNQKTSDDLSKIINDDISLSNSILNSIPMPFLLVDTNECVVKTNQACLDMLEIDGDVECCYGRTLADIFYNDPVRKTYVGQSIKEGKVFRDISVPIKSHRKDDRYVLANVFPLFNCNKICIGGMCIYVDSTERKQLERRLKELATTDSLTGLNNRQHCMDLAGALFNTAKRYDSDLAVSIFDIDHFKTVNDTRGHDAGDMVLKNLSRTAQDNFRSADVLGRIGGEEFVVIMPATGYQKAVQTMERFRYAVESNSITYGNTPLYITVSCGVALITSDDSTLESLIKKADLALYNAKRSGRNKVVAFI